MPLLTLLVGTLVAATVAGCADRPVTPSPSPSGSPSPSESPSRSESPARTPASAGATLVVLSDPGGRPALTMGPANGPMAAVALPPGDVRWIAADAAGRLVATLADGRILRTTGRAGPDPTWTPIPPALPSRDGPPLSFAMPDPSSGRLAALAAAFGTGEPASLVVLDAADGAARSIALGVEAAGSAPAWLDGQRVAAAVFVAGGARLAIVDVTRSHVALGPAGIRAIAVAGRAGRIATVAADGRTIEIHSLDAWLASPPGPPLARIEPPPYGIVTSLALDASGASLAAAWTDADLVPSAVFVAGGTGWRETAHIAVGAGVTRTVVAWLPPGGPEGPP